MNTTNKDNNLGSLSNSALIDRLREVSKKEIGTTVELLKHLNEVDKRKLFLDLGYSSLFSYLVSGLNYCKGSAYRRIACARLAEVYPSAYQYLCSREVSLTTAALISGQCMKESTEKGRDLLESIRGKSKTEVEQLLAVHRPVPKVRESLKPVSVHEKVKPESKTGSLFSLEKLNTKKSGSVSKEPTAEPSLVSPGEAVATPEAREHYHLSFSIDSENKKKLERVQSLMSNRGAKSLEAVFSVLLETYLDKHCPERRSARREKRKARKNNTTTAKRSHRNIVSRHIPAQVRDEVFKRDGLRCSYVSPDGVRCQSRSCLELDHIHPHALGGKHSKDNLRVLCSAHNQHAAVRVFGKEFMKKVIRG